MQNGSQPTAGTTIANELLAEFLKKEYSMEGFKDLVSDVGGTDISNLHRGMIGISKILQTNANPPIQEVIDANLVSKIVGFLESTNSPQLQLSASQALKHIASGTSEQCKPIFDKGGIPLIVGLLGSKDTGMKCESVQTINNLSKNCKPHSDEIIRKGGLINLIGLTEGQKEQQTLVKKCCQAITNLCKGSRLNQANLGVPALCRVISDGKLTDGQALADCCQVIYGQISRDKNKIQTVMNSGVVPRLIKNLEDTNKRLVLSSIQILRCISEGPAYITELLTNKIFGKLEIVLVDRPQNVKREACIIVANIASGKKQNVQQVLAQDSMIVSILDLFKKGSSEVKAQICPIFSNMACSGDPANILRFYQARQIASYYLTILSQTKISSVESIDSQADKISTQDNAHNQKMIKIAIKSLFVILSLQEKLREKVLPANVERHLKILGDIIEDYSANQTEQQKFNDNIVTDNSFILQFLKKRKKKLLLGKANAQIQFLDQQIKKAEHQEHYINRHSVIHRQVVPLVDKYLNAKRTYKDYDNNIFANNQFVHLFNDKIDYHIFNNAQEQLLKDKKTSLKQCLSSADIIQGQINDCYYLAAIAALTSKYPQMIYRLFVTVKNPSDFYAVRLFIQGKWQIVTLDLQFPITNLRNYYCALPNDKKIWPLLLQKAYAKVNGSYEQIHFGSDQQGIQVLTGAPSIYVSTDDKNLQKIIERQCKLGSLLTASLTYKSSVKQGINKQKKILEDLGLVGDHSYSILGVFPNVMGDTLIKIRNPWGKKEGVWKGKWNINDQIWTKQLRTLLGYNLDPKDGTFFMGLEDFKDHYTWVNICRVYQNNTNSWLDLKCQNGKFMAVGIKIHEKGNYAFTLYLEKRRTYPTKQKIYKQRCSWLFLLRKQGAKFSQVGSKCISYENNTLPSDGQLEKGEYLILVRAKWNKTIDINYSYRLASYGPKQVWMQPELFKESYLYDFIESERQLVERQQTRFKHIFKKMKFSPVGGYGFIQIANEQTYAVEVQIEYEMVNEQYLTIGSDFKFNKRYSVVPGQIFNRKLIIEPSFKKGYLDFTIRKSSVNNIDLYNQSDNIGKKQDGVVIARFKSNPDNYGIAKLVLNFFGREQDKGSLIQKSVKEKTLKDMRSNNVKKEQWSSDDQSQQIIEQTQYIITPLKKQEQGKLGEAMSQISYIDRIKGDIDNLINYFNKQSKLDKEFGRIAAIALNNPQSSFKDKTISCSLTTKWKDLREEIQDYCLFSYNTSQVPEKERTSDPKDWLRAKDIIKGDIMDAYLLAPAAALANRYPQLIYRLFVLRQNPSNIYGVRLFIEGKWQTVTLDLSFPLNEKITQNRYFCGAQPNGKEIWPMLLQKAYAKVNGSYDDIQFGTDAQGIQLLTGAPSKFYNMDIKIEAEDQIKFWKTFEEQHKRGSIVTASLIIDFQDQEQQQREQQTTVQKQKQEGQGQKQKEIQRQKQEGQKQKRQKQKRQKQKRQRQIQRQKQRLKQEKIRQQQQRIKRMGLVPNHCYSVLDFIPGVQGSDQQVTTLIRLRSPWGTPDKVWNGDWSNKSPLWTEQLRKDLDYKEDSDDVSFFMCHQDFKRYNFKQINICQVQQGYTNSWLDVKCKNNDEFTAVQIQIPKDGNGDYFFSLYLKGRRSFRNKDIINRCSWLFLLKKQGQKFKRVGASCLQVENNTVKGQKLEAGRYMIVIKVKWQHDLNQEYCLTSYGPKQVWMKPAQFKESYLNYCIPIEESEKWGAVNKKIDQKIKRRKYFDSEGGFGYIEVKNTGVKIVDVQIYFSDYQGILIVLSPYKTPVVLQVEPGKTACCKFLAETSLEKQQIRVKFKQPKAVDK